MSSCSTRNGIVQTRIARQLQRSSNVRLTYSTLLGQGEYERASTLQKVSRGTKDVRVIQKWDNITAKRTGGYLKRWVFESANDNCGLGNGGQFRQNDERSLGRSAELLNKSLKLINNRRVRYKRWNWDYLNRFCFSLFLCVIVKMASIKNSLDL